MQGESSPGPKPQPTARSRTSADARALLDDDRYFDPEPDLRRIARELFDAIRTLPLICPHGHVEAGVLARDEPLPEPTALLVLPDHYILRMLYSRGIPLESLGISTRGGPPVDVSPARVWQIFADNLHLFRGTPTDAWLRYQLHEVFGIGVKLDGRTAERVYKEIQEKLRSPEFGPRSLFRRFAIEFLATTNAATDELRDHLRIQESGWQGRVVPTFRPDALFQIDAPAWRAELAMLERLCGFEISDYGNFVRALGERRSHFKSLGATSTDHAVVEPYTERLRDETADALFQKALQDGVGPGDRKRFEGHMLMEMARMSIEDGLVMQLHAGSLRDHNRPFHARFGSDRGGDIPVATEFTRNLRPLLDAYGNDDRLTLILFTLDESTYSRELAPLAGHYPAVRLGPPWWFHDSIAGIRRFLESTVETAGIYNTVGFNDDSRAFCSIPARHDLARRVTANWLAGLVARHIVDMPDALEMAYALAYGLPCDVYVRGRAPRSSK